MRRSRGARAGIGLTSWLALTVLAGAVVEGGDRASQAQPATRSIRLGTGPNGSAEELYRNSYALLVGESRYDDRAAWPPLDTVPSELATLKRTLLAVGFDAVEEVYNPTGRELRDAVEAFKDRYGYKEGTRLLFFFAGHGYTYENRGYFVPRDAPDPLRDLQGFRKTALSMDQVATWARDITARHALFAFDSCFSGSIFQVRSRPIPDPISQMTGRKARVFVTAGDAGETVPSRSVFAPTFTRGLEGAADLNKDGFITGTELGNFVQSQVIAYRTRQTPQFGKLRDPDYDGGDIVFAVPAQPIGDASTSLTSIGAIAALLAASPTPGPPRPAPPPAPAAAPARLDIESTNPHAGTHTIAPPLAADPVRISVNAGGVVQVSRLTLGDACKGWASARPDAILNVTAAMSLLRLYVTAQADTALIVRDPRGQWHCNDDTDGRNPDLAIASAPAGRYAVWVSKYGDTAVTQVGEFAAGTLYVTAAARNTEISYRFDVETLSTHAGTQQLSPGFTPDPARIDVRAGGLVKVSNSGLGTACKGWASTRPDVIVNATASFGRLRFYVRSASDTTLIVRGPTGTWHCNDDGSGRDPDVTIDRAAPGTYRVWVGKYGDVMGDNVDAVLYVTERPAAAAAAPLPAAAPAPVVIPRLTIDGAKAHSGSKSLTPGFEPDPAQVIVNAGGRVQLSTLQLGGSCKGWASFDPDVFVDLTGTSAYLRFYVTAPADTALVILDPRGTWHCNDDAIGNNPEVVISSAAAGRYRVWVTKYGDTPATQVGDYVRSTLFISERRR